MFADLLKAIQKHETIIIHRHSRPDGDALGSQIGMKYLIENNFPHKSVYIVGDGPGYLGFMDGAIMDEIPDGTYDGALAIILDTSSAHMISDERYTKATMTARMDHHIFQGKIAQVEACDSTFESCCGLITQFALECGLKLNAKAAKALYTGMVTDSGRFRYDSTNARTLRLASALLEQDFDTNDIYRGLYAETMESKQLRARFILKAQLASSHVAYIYTTKEEMQELGRDVFTISRGMVNTMADLRGVEIWANFTETDEGVICELRSAEQNINPIAVKYGGGGHAKACGATVRDRETAMAMLDDLKKLIGDM